MALEDEYQLKYLDSLDDVPISGPDEYSPQKKRKAIFNAEAELEVDVNDGKTIDQSNVTDVHKAAVMNLATHILTHAAEEPSSVTLGDMEDGGGTITQYSSVYRERYDSLVDKIVSTGIGSSSGRHFSISVNNGTVSENSSTHVS